MSVRARLLLAPCCGAEERVKTCVGWRWETRFLDRHSISCIKCQVWKCAMNSCHKFISPVHDLRCAVNACRLSFLLGVCRVHSFVSLVAWAVFRDVLLFVSLVFMNCLTCSFYEFLWRSAYFVSKLSKLVSLCCDCGAILLVSVFSRWFCFPVVIFWIECFSVSSCSKNSSKNVSDVSQKRVDACVCDTLNFRHILASQDCKRTCPFPGDNPRCKTFLI